MEIVVLCLTVCVVKTLAIAVFGCVEGEPLRLQKLELGAGEGGPAPARPASVRMVLSGTAQTESSHPGGPADPDVTRWGWGAVLLLNLTASDKNPQERLCCSF